jgi:hypothetical protein
VENKFCSKCSYPFTAEGFAEAKKREEEDSIKMERLLKRQDRFEEMLQSMIDSGQLKPVAAG